MQQTALDQQTECCQQYITTCTVTRSMVTFQCSFLDAIASLENMFEIANSASAEYYPFFRCLCVCVRRDTSIFLNNLMSICEFVKKTEEKQGPKKVLHSTCLFDTFDVFKFTCTNVSKMGGVSIFNICGLRLKLGYESNETRYIVMYV